MLVLGLTGGLDAAHETVFDLAFDEVHDSAAALVRDGRVVAAVEEERLNRIKHTNKTSGPAIRACLDAAGATLEDLDAVAFYATEDYCQRVLQLLHLRNPSRCERLTPRGMVQRIVLREFGRTLDERKVRFVGHHWAHAVSAYHFSGFDRALVMTIDGQGEGLSGMAFDATGHELQLLRSMPERDSLGFLYRDVIRFLGYEMFDEYKVMGMAPYGDPARFRRLFTAFYDLLPDGEYRLHLERVAGLFEYLSPRKKGEPFTRTHHDLAAALQEALEIVGGHLVRHFQQATGQRQICLAGGVAHNCSLNGKLLYSGLFDRMFVQPASHDAGCALGAALAVELAEGGGRTAGPVAHVFWGTDIGEAAAVERELAAWSGFVAFERRDDIVEAAADLLADGKVLGWVQGRAEFGPRALGHRSILADPRPAEHKDLINRMVKKREAYRPFAPSVLEERVDDFFVVPAAQKRFPYMTVVVDVQPDKRELLGAVTHVDGTARIQTVDRDANRRYWDLIEAFGRRTGVPIVLNTSFNNHAEPIVDSVRDAVVCFLTTDLHYLVVGDYLVSKRTARTADWLALRVSLPPAVVVSGETRHVDAVRVERSHRIAFTYHHGKSARLSPALYGLLADADGRRTVGALASACGLDEAAAAGLLDELTPLWSARMVRLEPAE
ncbi:MAG TPA: carbamoyltransferase C-terminal domain-containing protein [Vicinamibacterales bacterium]|nr:carbamoyltransferase C-terminal domain-containing protein [Vicinamibacterales bacterium]